MKYRIFLHTSIILCFFFMYYIAYFMRNDIVSLIFFTMTLGGLFLALLSFYITIYIRAKEVKYFLFSLAIFIILFCSYRWMVYNDMELYKNRFEESKNLQKIIDYEKYGVYEKRYRNYKIFYTVYKIINDTENLFGIISQNHQSYKDFEKFLYAEKNLNGRFYSAIKNINYKYKFYYSLNSTVYVPTNIYNQYNKSKKIEELVFIFSICLQAFIFSYFFISGFISSNNS